MEKEETQNKENQNLKDENSELSTDKQASEETEKKDEEEQLSPENEIANLKDKVTRTFAEMENQRRRFEKEKDEAFEYGGFSFARETLNLLDNLERSKQTLESDETIKDKDTLKKLIEHINIINKDMISIFKKNNIEPIKAINEKLDPNLHQAMMEVEDDTKDQGTIVQEIQKGFMMKDRLLRPSLVAVSKKKVEKKQNNQKDKEIEEKEAKN
ncbi:nucleotide exchange factor GrpE [Candidatus Pelagibacter sp.]|nr:nucleotide exchange factor GrpE [Candidatus Pelagibacter sp.]